MFYLIDDDIVSVEIENVQSKDLVAGFVVADDVQNVAQHFNFNQQIAVAISNAHKHYRSDVKLGDSCIFGTFRLMNQSSLGFYIAKNMLLIVDICPKKSQGRQLFMNLLGKLNADNACIEKLVAIFFDCLIAEDLRYVEQVGEQINLLEETVEKDKVKKDFNLLLLNVKKRLLSMRNYCEQLLDIAEALLDNQTDIFDSANVLQFKQLAKKVQRLKESIDVLRDNVVHIKDAYQSYLELKLNETMKIFTVFNVVFLPLTLITGWYGMNFAYMPELSWRYGYAYVIGIALLVIAAFIFIFKKKRWL